MARALRLLAKVCLGAMALVAVLVACALLALAVPGTRRVLGRWGLEQLNPVIAGRVEVGSLHKLTPWNVRVSEVEVREASGDVVGSIEELEVRLAPWALLDGTLRIREVRVEGLRAELGDLAEADQALIGALTPADTESVSEGAGDPMPLEIQVDALSVRQASATASLQGSSLSAELPVLRAEGRYGEVPRIAVQELRMHVERNRRTWLHLETRQADWSAEGGGAAHLSGELSGRPLSIRLRAGEALRGSSLRASLDGPGDGRVSLRADYTQEDLTVKLQVRDTHLQSFDEALPDLRVAGDVQASAADPFTAPHETRLSWSGLRIDGRGVPEGEARLRYDEPQLEVAELRLGADGALRGSGSVHTGDGRAAVDLRAGSLELSSLAGVGEVRGTLNADVAASRDRAGRIAVELSGRASSLMVGGLALRQAELRARGHALPEGPLEVHLEGEFRGLRAGSSFVEAGHLQANADGATRAPTLHAQLEADGARLGSLSPLQLGLAFDGDLDAAALEVRAEGPSSSRLDLHVEAARTPEGVDLSSAGRLRVAGRGYQIRMSGARVRLESTLRARIASFTLQRGAQHLELRGTVTPASLRARASLRALNLTLLSELGLAEVEGTVERASLQVSGRPSSPAASLDARFAAVQVAGAPALDGQVSTRLDVPAGEAEVHADVRTARDRGFLRAELSSRWQAGGSFPSRRQLTSAEHEVQVSARGVNLALLRPYLPVEVPGLDGQAGAQLSLSGSLDAPTGDGWVGLSLRGTPQATAQRIRLSVDLEPETVSARLIARQGWAEVLRAKVSWPESVGALLDRARDPVALLSRDFEIEASLEPQRIDRLRGAYGQWLGLVSLEIPLRASGQVTLTGHGERVEGEGQAQVVTFNRGFDGRCALKAQSEMDAVFSLSEKQVSASLDAKPQASGSVRADLRMPLDLRAWLRDGSGLGQATLTAEARDVALHQIPGMCALTQGHGDLSLRAERLGSPDAWAKADLQVDDLQLRDEPPTGLRATVRADAAALKLDGTVSVAGAQAGELEAEVPLSLSEGPLPHMPADEPLHASLRLDSVPLASLLAGVDAVGQVDGSLSADLQLGGTLQKPRPSGFVKFEKLSLSIATIAQPLHDITGRIRIDDRRLEILDLEVHDRDGTARISGTADYTLEGTGSADVRVEVEDLPVRRNGTIIAEANTRIEGAAQLDGDGVIDVDISVHGGRLWLTGKSGDQVISLEPMPEIRFVSEPEEVEQQETEPPVELGVLRLSTDQNFWIMHKDFSVQVGADVEVRADPNTRMTGAVRLVRGELTLLGSAFRIEEGEIRFTGSSPPEPQLDITAVHSMPTGEDLQVQVTGRALQPTLSFSGAATNAGEAVAAMTGFGQAGAEGQAQSQASDFAVNLMAGLLSVAARREFGSWVPLLSVESGTEGIERLRAGFDASHLIPAFLKGVTRGFYIEGIVGEGRGGGQQETAPMRGLGVGVSAEVAFPYDIVTSGTYGPGSTWSADIGWAP